MLERTVFAVLVISFALVLFLMVRDWEKRRPKKKRKDHGLDGGGSVGGGPVGGSMEWDFGDGGGD